MDEVQREGAVATPTPAPTSRDAESAGPVAANQAAGKRSGLAADLAVLNCLLSFVLCMAFPLTLIIHIPLTIYVWRLNRLAAILSLALSLYALMIYVGFFGALIGYFTGSAQFYSAFRPADAVFGSFRPKYATTSEWYGGDIGWPMFGFHELPNNLTLYLMCGLFGPVKGNYHGPVPTEDEARYLISKHGVSLPLATLNSGDFELGDVAVHLSWPAYVACTSGIEYHDPSPPVEFRADPAGSAFVALHQARCLVVSVSCPAGEILSLVDPRTGRLIEQVFEERPGLK